MMTSRSIFFNILLLLLLLLVLLWWAVLDASVGPTAGGKLQQLLLVMASLEKLFHSACICLVFSWLEEWGRAGRACLFSAPQIHVPTL